MRQFECKRYAHDSNVEFILGGVNTSIWPAWNLISFQNCDPDNVNIEIGILTYPKTDAMSKRVFCRYSHGTDLPNEWISI